MEKVINIDGFCKEYRIDSEGKFGHYKPGHCAICNRETTQVDATMLWDGIPTYLCSDVCYDKYWKNITCLTSQTKEVTMDFESNYQKLIEKLGNPMPGTPVTSEYVIEECAELIQAIQHARRGRKNANPVKEMAHVYTLLDALCVYWEVTDEEIRKYKQELIDRYLNQPNDGRHIESLTSQTKEG